MGGLFAASRTTELVIDMYVVLSSIARSVKDLMACVSSVLRETTMTGLFSEFVVLDLRV